jgi:hypothetical protein
MAGLEVKTERDRTVRINGGPPREVVRITFRPEGERRWRRILVIPGPSQTLAAIEAQAPVIAARFEEKWPSRGV